MKPSLFLICSIFFVSNVFSQKNEGPPYIKSIFFGGGDYYIDNRQKQELNDFLDGIDGLEQYQIIVTSHTDTIGSLEYNQRLSQMRSMSTIRLLELRGIPEAVIQRKDYGELNPDFDNRTWEGKLRNRRADVILIPPDS